MIVNRPLSSVVAVYVVGPMFGFSAVTVAPLIGIAGIVLDEAADAADLGRRVCWRTTR